MSIGDRSCGYSSPPVKGHFRYGHWKERKYSSYTFVCVTNEHDTSHTCIFRFPLTKNITQKRINSQWAVIKVLFLLLSHFIAGIKLLLFFFFFYILFYFTFSILNNLNIMNSLSQVDELVKEYLLVNEPVELYIFFLHFIVSWIYKHFSSTGGRNKG